MEAPTLPRYPVYIPSVGRAAADMSLTANCLTRDSIPFFLVVHPEEADAYAARFARAQILELPFPKCGYAVPARNWIKAHSLANGDARHWQLDDNMRLFRRRYRGKRIPVKAGIALRATEDFVDRYTNVALAAIQYTMFVIAKMPAFYVNAHVYSCVAPETPVLCADLVWRAAGELAVGQEIVAFDAEPAPAGRGVNARSYRTATVQANLPATKPSYRLWTDDGPPIQASAEHPWLVWRAPLRQRHWGDGMPGDPHGREELGWVPTADLRVGDRLAFLGVPWERDESHEAGWISGLYDGEGSCTVRQPPDGRGIQLGIAQGDGPVLDRLVTGLRARGYGVGVSGAGGSGSQVVRTARIGDGFRGALRFAGEFGPTRLLAKAAQLWEGRGVRQGQSYSLATITEIVPLGDQLVASIQTSTGTFITAGYLTHNCTLVNNSIPHAWRGRYNDDTDITLQVLADGWCTVVLNAFMVDKMRTLTMKGGMNGVYQGDGRLEMARSLERVWPGVVTTIRRFKRPQHWIRNQWQHFDTPLQYRPDFDPTALPKVDELGMELRAVREVQSARLRGLLADREPPS